MGSGLSRQLEAFRGSSVCKKVVHGVGCGGRGWGIVKMGLVALLLAAIIFAPTLGLGVVESRVSAAPVPNASAWTAQESPAPSVDFDCIWGDSSNSVFAVGGSNGTVIRYDGTAWSVFDAVPFLPPDPELGGGISDIWYSSPSQMFFIGGYWNSVDDYFYGVYQYDRGVWTKTQLVWGDSDQLNGIWGTSASDVFVVGGEWGVSGYVFHYSGDSWTERAYYPELEEVLLRDVWGTSSSNVFAVGGYSPYGGGAVFRYDGLSWQPMNIGATPDLWGVWGSSSSDVFAVGYDGTILHYNGSAWSTMSSGTSKSLSGVWGSSGSDVFAVGEAGTILHYDGHAWSTMSSGTSKSLSGVWGSSSSDVFVVGEDGTILHYGGAASPGVATNPATSVTQTSATLNGSLTSLGGASSAQVSLEWGLTASYSSTTPVQTMNATGAFSATLTGLTPGTTYHFRAKAVGGMVGGTTAYGTDSTFTTPVDSVSPSVTTNAAIAVTQTSATLNGNLSSLGSASSVQVSFEWGPGTAHGNTTTPQTMNGTGSFSYPLSGLSPATTYDFRAKAEGASTNYGGDMTFTTASTPVLPPTVTTNAATGAGMDVSTLNGTLTGLGSAASVQVAFEWGPTASYGNSTPPGTMSGTGNFSADLNGLAAGATYHYRAKAVGDDTAYGNDMTLTTSATPTAPPAVATGDADSVTASSARLNGDLTSLGTASSVTVSFVWGNTQGGPYTNETTGAAQTAAGAFRFDLSGLASGTTFYYQAKAVGNGASYGAEKSFTTAATTSGAPVIGSLVADNGRPGDDLTLTITGSNLSGATAVSFGAGIIVNDFRVVSDTEITAKIAIASGAEAGDRDITVTTPQGTGTTAGAFKVNEVGSKVHLWVYLVAAVGGLAVLGGSASLGVWLRRRLAS